MGSEENGKGTGAGSSMQSPRKSNPSKRVTMSGVENVQEVDTTADVKEEGGGLSSPASTAAVTDDGNLAPEEAPVAENGSSNDQTETPAPPKRLTKVERLVGNIEKRRENRMEVSQKARKKFLSICRAKVGGDSSIGIPIAELRTMRDEHRQDGEVGPIFECAVNLSETIDAKAFYFRDFNEYYLTLQDTYLRRNPFIGAIVGVLAYYICSLILFCGIMGNNSTCPSTAGGPAYEGWLSAIYFASVTISTVGYGDVSVVGSGTEVWRVSIGVAYMVYAMVVAVTVFSSLSSRAMDIAQNTIAPKLEPFLDKWTTMKKSEALAAQLKRVWVFKVVELSLEFLLINLFGMCCAMIVMATTEDGDKIDWSWMTAFYWAVQTTTTIGYGDLDMPFDLRWFNFFFAIVGTTFAASILSSLSDLKTNMKEMRRLYVWKHQEVSMQLIADMEGDGDNSLDEYEFLIGSLLTLEKIQPEDVEEIMDKFRALAGADGIIDQKDVEDHHAKLSTLSKSDIERYNAQQREKMEE
eukprot:CAMPEP_0113651462 /NCGR_PEP_ID=MMETSP0017_2-20120614/27424_1 /TAXON_ID=2856 /ORGANISM="Cylindrotheca closterium" /LENGTH=522 /DNA_ID=CAMNT_0000564121 /DNA_START=67 /DNA_END=1635 /DNA_ORIENTATION=- /assembly_acc=CAM_ASM_000147